MARPTKALLSAGDALDRRSRLRVAAPGQAQTLRTPSCTSALPPASAAAFRSRRTPAGISIMTTTGFITEGRRTQSATCRQAGERDHASPSRR